MENYKIYGNPYASCCIVQMQGEHEQAIIEQELLALEQNLCAENQQFNATNLQINIAKHNWCLVTVPVNDWDREMSPWPAEQAKDASNKENDSSIKGLAGRDFGDGAKAKLEHLINEIIPDFEEKYPLQKSVEVSDEKGKEAIALNRHYGLAGYSLAGLFALWASYQTDRFEGIAAMSPSVWYPGWIEYARENECNAKQIYLSLGSREHKTRNKLMATVSDAIREQQEILISQHKETILEWNEGNHFADVPFRIGKGIACLINEMGRRENAKKNEDSDRY